MAKIKVNEPIIIKDWAGNVLFEGPCDSPKAFHVLSINDHDDIFLDWADSSIEENPWEYVDFDSELLTEVKNA